MSRKSMLIKGTFILTLTGLITRIMGFFYRIFLSYTFGESGVGLYQLIFPVYALGFSITSAGIELALSRCVSKHIALGSKKNAREMLYSSIILTTLFSLLFTLLLQKNAAFIAEKYLHNTNTAELLLILSYVFPFAAIHSCIVGYYLGLKETRVPSTSQILEQGCRIVSVFLFYALSIKLQFDFKISFAVLGLIVGEIFSSIYCLKTVSRKPFLSYVPSLSFHQFIIHTKELLTLSFPLTASRTLLNLLQSIEAIAIPLSLQRYGLNSSDALSVYGVLTGMALPCILFPSAITNAISTMLLPTVSEMQTLNEKHSLLKIIQKTVITCTFMGVFCSVCFIFLGEYFGALLFNSTLAGKFIVTLGWMCPFLYTNTTLLSIINGIGKTIISFFINTINLTIRIICVIFIIPVYGIYGYLSGLLMSQIFVFSFCIFYLYKQFKAEVI